MTTRDDAMCAAGVEPCPCAAATLIHAAKEREAHDYTKGKLAGALAALRQLQECVPPKDWKRYASEVLALDARDRQRSNALGNRRAAFGASELTDELDVSMARR